MLNTEEKLKIFGKEDIVTIFKDKLQECYDIENKIEARIKQIHLDNLKLKDEHKWFGQYLVEQEQEKLEKINKLIKKYKFKIRMYNGDANGNVIDLDAIKQIPITDFMPGLVYKGHGTVHYKAPWRDESNPSVVVYLKDNRFHDFGDPEKRGTVIDLIMLLEDTDFKGAIKYLSNYL